MTKDLIFTQNPYGEKPDDMPASAPKGVWLYDLSADDFIAWLRMVDDEAPESLRPALRSKPTNALMARIRGVFSGHNKTGRHAYAIAQELPDVDLALIKSALMYMSAQHIIEFRRWEYMSDGEKVKTFYLRNPTIDE